MDICRIDENGNMSFEVLTGEDINIEQLNIKMKELVIEKSRNLEDVAVIEELKDLTYVAYSISEFCRVEDVENQEVLQVSVDLRQLLNKVKREDEKFLIHIEEIQGEDLLIKGFYAMYERWDDIYTDMETYKILEKMMEMAKWKVEYVYRNIVQDYVYTTPILYEKCKK